LNSILNNINIDETHLKTLLEADYHDKTELKHIMDDFFTPQKNLNVEQIKKKMRIILENENKKNQSRIDRLKRENIVKNLNDYEIINQLKKETKIVVILDNYPVHKAQLAQKACKILNIQLILLPPYSPKLNPIEQVWRIIKRELSKIYIEAETFLIQKFKSNYNEIIENKTFYEGWINKFIKTNR
jgi:transposase